MSEPRHATVWLVSELGDLLIGYVQAGTLACGSLSASEPATGSHYAPSFRNGTLPAEFRITCDRCAIIVDAALEGVKPFPFSLPGVPDEVLR